MNERFSSDFDQVFKAKPSQASREAARDHYKALAEEVSSFKAEQVAALTMALLTSKGKTTAAELVAAYEAEHNHKVLLCAVDLLEEIIKGVSA